jgi:hypothetical protein
MFAEPLRQVIETAEQFSVPGYEAALPIFDEGECAKSIVFDFKDPSVALSGIL